MELLILLFCLCIPLMVVVIIAISILQRIQNKKVTKATDSFWNRAILTAWDWVNIFTLRSIFTLILASIMFAIAAFTETNSILPLTLLSTMSVFLLVITCIFLGIAFLTKIYLSFKQTILQDKVYSVSISKSELTENEPSEISVNISAPIPPGYVLKIAATLPEKLGSSLRAAIGTKSNGKSEFKATIPYTKRGQYTVGPIKFIYQDILGLSKIMLTSRQTFSLNILPEIPQIKKYQFRLSSSKGEDLQVVNSLINTEDYFSTRPYVRGDDTRKMHWKLSAKTAEFVIRLPETTSISFDRISIVILNTSPRVDLQGKGNILLPYKYNRASEYALDSQIKIAGAFIDFALRLNIPVTLLYFQKNNLLKYTPYLDAPEQWKKQLSQISYANSNVNIQSLTDQFAPNSASIICTSDTEVSKLRQIITASSEKDVALDIMYTPISNHVYNLRDKTEKPGLTSKISKIAYKILFTKPYFEQTTFIEKLENRKLNYIQKYSSKDLADLITEEKKVTDELKRSNASLKVFSSQDNYASEVDNIVNIIEDEEY